MCEKEPIHQKYRKETLQAHGVDMQQDKFGQNFNWEGPTLQKCLHDHFSRKMFRTPKISWSDNIINISRARAAEHGPRNGPGRTNPL